MRKSSYRLYLAYDFPPMYNKAETPSIFEKTLLFQKDTILQSNRRS